MKRRKWWWRPLRWRIERFWEGLRWAVGKGTIWTDCPHCQHEFEIEGG